MLERFSSLFSLGFVTDRRSQLRRDASSRRNPDRLRFFSADRQSCADMVCRDRIAFTNEASRHQHGLIGAYSVMMISRLAVQAVAFTVGVSFLTSAAQASAVLPKRLAELTIADFAARTDVSAVPDADSMTFSTEHASKSEGRSKWLFIEEAFARLVVDNRTGERSWEIWHEVSRSGGIGRIADVRYTAKGLEHSAQPEEVEEWIGYCGPADWEPGCRKFTRFKFRLPEEHVRALAGDMQEVGSRRAWTLEMRDQKGRVAKVGFAPAELGGLLKAFEDFQRAGDSQKQTASAV